MSINIDASVYYRVVNARYAFYRVQNISAAIAEVTYAILKNTCGQFILQDILEKRQEISDDIEKQVDQYVEEWGADVHFNLFRFKRSSSKISNSVRIFRTHCQVLQSRGDSQKVKSYQQERMFSQLN